MDAGAGEAVDAVAQAMMDAASAHRDFRHDMKMLLFVIIPPDCGHAHPDPGCDARGVAARAVYGYKEDMQAAVTDMAYHLRELGASSGLPLRVIFTNAN